MGQEAHADGGIKGAVGERKLNDVSDNEFAALIGNEIGDAFLANRIASEDRDIESRVGHWACELAVSTADIEDCFRVCRLKEIQRDPFLPRQHPCAGFACEPRGIIR